MKRVLWVALLLASVGTVSAATYDDFSRGLNAINRGDADTAIASFSSALSAGDLAAGYVPTAYLDRARAYLWKGRCQEAIGDLNELLKLKSDDADAYELRANAEACLNKRDEALADFAAAIKLRPSAPAYANYARHQWVYGAFAQAADGYRQAVELSSKSNTELPYLILWYAMSADRAGTLDQAYLKEKMRAVDEDDWPGPVIELFQGKKTIERVYADAADRDATKAANQKCEADFYISEWQLARGKQDAAVPLLNQAVGECPHNFIEYYSAKAELERKP